MLVAIRYSNSTSFCDGQNVENVSDQFKSKSLTRKKVCLVRQTNEKRFGVL